MSRCHSRVASNTARADAKALSAVSRGSSSGAVSTATWRNRPAWPPSTSSRMCCRTSDGQGACHRPRGHRRYRRCNFGLGDHDSSDARSTGERRESAAHNNVTAEFDRSGCSEPHQPRSAYLSAVDARRFPIFSMPACWPFSLVAQPGRWIPSTPRRSCPSAVCGPCAGRVSPDAATSYLVAIVLPLGSLEYGVEVPLQEFRIRPLGSLLRQCDDFPGLGIERVAVAELAAQPGADP